MTVTLTQEIEQKLLEAARLEGTDPDDLANLLLHAALERRTDEFEADVQALSEGFASLDSGKVRPFDDFLHDHQDRYNEPSSHILK